MVKLTEEIWIIQRLIQIGFLVPLDSVNLYHGRANTTGEPFKVDPTHVGMGLHIPNMSLTTDYEGAKHVAESRSGDIYTPEVHKMVSLGGKYYFINTDMRLSANSRGEENECWTKFSTRKAIRDGVRFMEQSRSSWLSESFPAEQGMEKVYDQAYGELSKMLSSEHPFLLQEEIGSVVSTILETQKNNMKFKFNPEKFKADVQTIVTQFAGSINARAWLLDNPAMAIYGYMQKPQKGSNISFSGLSADSISFGKRCISVGLFERTNKTYDGKDIPINWEYLATWIKKNNIVGGISTRDSDTVGKKLPVYFLFDLDRVKTESEQNAVFEQIMNKYGELISNLSHVSQSEEIDKFLADATPEECIDFINKSKVHPNLAKLSSGVWEGYTVGEHTEAVLKLYEDNFARTLPQELQPFMKLTILLHDIGKGSAIEKSRSGERVGQHEETRAVCKDLFTELGINKQTSELINFIILDSQKYTSELYVYRNTGAEQQLLNSIKEKYVQIYNVEPTETQINGIASMCKILQTCDSYSYTPGAVIRRTGEHGDFYVRGANNNFARNSVVTRNGIEYTNPNGQQPSDPNSTIGVRKK